MSRSRFVQKTILAYDLLQLAWMAGSLKKAYGFLKRDRKPEQILCSYKGVRFCARKGDWPAIKEVFLDDEYACLRRLFDHNEKPKILDLGAHIGSFALVAFAHIKQATIYSAEAAQDTAEILQKNITLNPDLDWHIIQGAIWKKNEPIYLTRTQCSLGNKVGQNDTGEEVNAYTLEEIYNKTGWSQIDLIKMDIEGAEAEVIPVSQDVLLQTKAIIIEVHDDRIDGDVIVSELQNIFPYGYKLNYRGSSKPVYLFCKKDVQNISGWGRKIQ